MACILMFASPTLVYGDDSVTIELIGTVEQECGFTNFPANANLGVLNQTGLQLIVFGINCNTPFAYRLQSREGGLRHGVSHVATSGFVTLIPYAVEIRIPTNGGLIFDQCTSQSLLTIVAGCQSGDSGNDIAIGQTGSLVISWSLTGQPIAGTYSDVLTLEVYPQF